MVDALRRAHRMVTAAGLVIDVHPNAVPAYVEIGGDRVGPLDAEEAIARHTAADAAIPTVLENGILEVTARPVFVYHTYGDTIEELRDHIAANWRDSRIGDDTVQKARRVLHAAPGRLQPRVVEHVQLTAMRARSRPR